MKKNVVVIVVDSLSKKVIDEYPFKDELFLTSLEKQSTIYTKMYSNGPFTEAAMNGLFAGKQNDEFGSYLYGYDKCPNNLFNYFEKQSYKMYASGIMDTYAGLFDSTKDYIRHTTYYPLLSHLSYTRLGDYSSILEKRGFLKKEEKETCRSAIKVAVIKGIKYSYDYLTDKANCSSQKNILDKKEVADNLVSLLNIFEKLDEDAFLLETIKEKGKNICQSYKTSFTHDNEKKMLLDSCFKKLLSIQRQHEPSLGKSVLYKDLVKRFFKKPSPAKLKAFIGLKSLIYKKVSNSYGCLKNNEFIFTKVSVSLRKRLEDAKQFIKEQKNPFFIYLQPQDFHPTSSFYSYDIDDLDIIKKELDTSIKLAERMPKNIKCNIFPFLSLRYVDELLREFFSFLKDNNMLDNTVFVVTSDHGTWEYDDVVRNDTFNLMVEERSLVPCYLYSKDRNPEIKKDIISNASFPNILLDYCGFEECSDFLAKENTNNYVISSNFRFGAPDPFNKKIQYIVWYDDYKLVTSVLLNEGKEEKEASFYDLLNDKKEIVNLIDNKEYKDVIEYISLIVKERVKSAKDKLLNNYYVIPYEYETIFATIIDNAKQLIKNIVDCFTK